MGLLGFFKSLKKRNGNESESTVQKEYIRSPHAEAEKDVSQEKQQLTAKEARVIFDSIYKTDSIDGIRSIPVPEYILSKKYEEFTCKPEYFLDLKATEYKKAGNLEFAIECLKKANELRNCSEFFYTEKDYKRLVEYLRKARRFDEADEEERKIDNILAHKKDTIKNKRQVMYEKIYGEFNSDLVEVSYVYSCCPICAKYRGRVFSLNGEDARFPRFPKDFHEDCGLRYSPFVYELEHPVCCSKEEIIEYSNRPFIDDRTEEQKEGYLRILKEQEDRKQRELDRVEYNWLWKNIPEICPKTFNAYRRMKNSNSKGYVKLTEQKQLWIEKGYINIEKKPEKSEPQIKKYKKMSESEIQSFEEHLKEAFEQFKIQSEVIERREYDDCVQFDITAPEGMRIKQLQALKEDIDIRTPEASIDITPDFKRGVIAIKALYSEKEKQ